ncbi:MAG: Mut7-C RNAse domain-containing protein [Candidatus Bathyarchaeota archaeon]|nr:MAG: Mut7-C RNAse domain-containing protein [Candidatus Bathyarchaeota archaeon]
MKFIADGMLGKLTRWLRMLGQDVEYSRSLNDEQLIKTAKAENRVLLTRDLKLYQLARKQGVDATLIKSAKEAEKLASLAKQFNFKLEIDVTISRCPKCNTSIKSVSKNSILVKIPEATSTYYDEFWECLGCEQIYWRGSHWKRIEKTLKAARQALKNP